ncbi:MAG: hypothetical protein ACK6DA_16640 [Candidatus Kapaibacterium sp.]
MKSENISAAPPERLLIVYVIPLGFGFGRGAAFFIYDVFYLSL